MQPRQLSRKKDRSERDAPSQRIDHHSQQNAQKKHHSRAIELANVPRRTRWLSRSDSLTAGKSGEVLASDEVQMASLLRWSLGSSSAKKGPAFNAAQRTHMDILPPFLASGSSENLTQGVRRSLWAFALDIHYGLPDLVGECVCGGTYAAV